MKESGAQKSIKEVTDRIKNLVHFGIDSLGQRTVMSCRLKFIFLFNFIIILIIIIFLDENWERSTFDKLFILYSPIEISVLLITLPGIDYVNLIFRRNVAFVPRNVQISPRDCCRFICYFLNSLNDSEYEMILSEPEVRQQVT